MSVGFGGKMRSPTDLCKACDFNCCKFSMGVSGSSDGSPSAVLELVVPSDCRGELGAPFFFSKKNRVSNSVFFV